MLLSTQWLSCILIGGIFFVMDVQKSANLMTHQLGVYF